MLGVDVDPAARLFQDRHPEVTLRMKRLRWWDNGESLLNGLVDVGFVRLPFPSRGLRLLPLYAEPLTVALPGDHPLAGRSSVDIAELAAEPVLRYADAHPDWNAFWTIDPRPDGRRPRQGPAVRDMEEIVQYVRAGTGVVFLPVAIAGAFPRPDIAYVPLTGAPAGRIALAWATAHASPLIDAFAATAREMIVEPAGAGPGS